MGYVGWCYRVLHPHSGSVGQGYMVMCAYPGCVGYRVREVYTGRTRQGSPGVEGGFYPGAGQWGN